MPGSSDIANRPNNDGFDATAYWALPELRVAEEDNRQCRDVESAETRIYDLLSPAFAAKYPLGLLYSFNSLQIIKPLDHIRGLYAGETVIGCIAKGEKPSAERANAEIYRGKAVVDVSMKYGAALGNWAVCTFWTLDLKGKA